MKIPMQLRRFKFAARIRLCFALVIVALIGVGTFAMYQAREIRQASLVIEQDALPGIALGDDLTLAFAKTRFGVMRLLTSANEIALTGNYESFVAGTQEFAAAQEAYRRIVSNDQERAMFTTIGTLFEQYRTSALDVHEWLKQGAADQANALVNGDMTAIAQSMTKALSELEHYNDQAQQTASAAGQQAYQTAICVTVIVIVLSRLPRIELGHSDTFLRRRVGNWVPVGLLYAFLYMGRYNLTVSKDAFGDLMSNTDFGTIFGVGTAVYGSAFLINGPLTDRWGGKKALLIGGAGAISANLAMGAVTHFGVEGDIVLVFSVLYGVNMYFQSFGAVAIVKINAPWFHVRERGVFGAIFGILISLGVYFAFDIGYMILNAESLGLTWVFFMPAILLAVFWVFDFLHVRNTPGEAGLVDFDTKDASSGDDGPQRSALDVFKLMLRNPIILTIAGIEFCSGFLRQAIMQWYRTFAKQTDGELALKGDFVYENWGMLLCCAGILGGVFAGTLSDHLFKSRRGPVAAVLYAIMFVGSLFLIYGYQQPYVGWVVLFMSMAVIGVHGMLSGTASMDFGGRKNVGVAVGIIDGFVYMGTAIMSMTYAIVLPKEELDEAGQLIGPATDPDNWRAWPIAMVPLALLGLILATRVWNATPTAHKKAT